MKKALLICLLAGACGGDDKHELFTPKPECKGDAITPYAGTFPQVINTLNIGSVQDGFDLDGDGKPDNKLAAVGSLAMSAISDSIKNTEIVIPIEFFNLPSVAATTCVKFAIYLGISDADGDGKKPVQHNGDCNDHDPNIAPGKPEIDGNHKDDDCDGLADENGSDNSPNTTETVDMDGDGQSVAQGDCDDTNPMVKKGAPEICGDGLDNDCDGVADRTEDAMGNSIACNPFDATNLQDIALDPLSLMGGQPVIAFTSGTIDSKNHLVAGPGTFSVNIPVTNGITLDLKISGATIEATLGADGTTMNGKLGGVIDAKTADTIRGLSVSQIGLTPQQSLLDATFANILGSLLALPKAKASVLKMYPDCRTPDIDVDGDGLEAFCDSDPNDDVKEVDTCIDGDGKVYKDVKDANGTVTKQCTEFTDSKGKPLFVDGISVELNFTTTKIKSIKPPITQ
ncbi:MAG TPA: putative metal-binding motif-containing protein [Kofleriaceae bacterium]|nr:putative metal-binding motif-containing protein [Kofleriaceae bacterium]